MIRDRMIRRDHMHTTLEETPMSSSTARAMISVAKVCTAEANRAAARGQHRYAASMCESAALALREAGVGTLPEHAVREIRERRSTARAQALAIVQTYGRH
jgi:hypothetical protein